MKLIYLEWEDTCDNSSVWRIEEEVLEWGKMLLDGLNRRVFLLKKLKKKLFWQVQWNLGIKIIKLPLKILLEYLKLGLEKEKQ